VFVAIVVAEVSQEAGAEISEALAEAPVEVKESFEEEINVFDGVFDNYVALGSSIDVGDRRTVLAATAAVAAIATAAAAGGTGAPQGSSGGSSGGSGGSSNGGSSPEGRSRKEEESGQPSGEIAGPEGDDNASYARNTIYKYYIKEGKEMKKFNWFGFSKKIWDITAGLAFTLAGSFVVYITLSGSTQKLAGISTLVALFVHYLSEILKNDTE